MTPLKEELVAGIQNRLRPLMYVRSSDCHQMKESTPSVPLVSAFIAIETPLTLNGVLTVTH